MGRPKLPEKLCAHCKTVPITNNKSRGKFCSIFCAVQAGAIGKPSKISPEKLNEMKKLYIAGKSTTEIGKKFGIDHTTVLYHFGRIRKNRISLHGRETLISEKAAKSH